MDGGYGYVALDIVMQSILLNPKEYTVCYELLDPKGEVVAMSQKDIVTGMLSRDTVRFTVRIPDPLVWNHETPNLYTLLVRSRNEGRFVENAAVRVGFRTPGTSDGVFLIDGLPVGLYAVRYAMGGDEGAAATELARFKAEGITASLQTELPSRTVSMRFATVWGCTCAMRRISIRVGNRPVSPWAAIRATLPNGKMPTSTGYTACITLRTFIRRW